MKKKIIVQILGAVIVLLLLSGCVESKEAREIFENRTGIFSVTVYPVNVITQAGTEHQDQVAKQLIEFLKDEEIAEGFLAETNADIEFELSKNQQKMLRRSCESFSEFIRTQDIQTDYALLVDILKGRVVGGVHLYLVDPAGNVADVGLTNSHWDEFKKVRPVTIEDGGTVAKMMMKRKWGVPSKDELYLSEKYWKKASAEDVNEAVADGLNVNASNESGWTVLISAAGVSADPGVVERLVKLGADVNAGPGDQRLTALMRAAYKNPNPEMVERLVKLGADVNAQDEKGRAALIFAAWANPNPDVVERLAKLGADVNAKKKNGLTALMFAAERRNPDFVERLVEQGADVNAKADTGFTALWHAVWHTKNLDVLNCLVQLGADVNARNIWGGTPLMGAAKENRNPEFLDRLVELGVDVNARNKNGATALMTAAQYTKEPKIIGRLLELGADVEMKDAWGNTALDFAQRNESRKKDKIYRILAEAMEGD